MQILPWRLGCEGKAQELVVAFASHSSHLLRCKLALWPIGPVWSGRHLVTVEIAGSNPAWVA